MQIINHIKTLHKEKKNRIDENIDKKRKLSESANTKMRI